MNSADFFNIITSFLAVITAIIPFLKKSNMVKYSFFLTQKKK